jgi:hypothetical protein
VKSLRHSVLMAGAAILTASTVAISQSVEPSPPPSPAPTVHLAADVQLLALADQPPLLSVLISSPWALLGPAAPFGTLPPAPAPLAIPIAPNIANTVDNIYIAVEPWVRYGFEVATAVVRWIPYIGWFAGQIMVFYNFFEGMINSGVFNFTDWLRGDGGIAANLVDFGIDVGLAFIWLGLDEVAQFFPLPPFCCYPPRPPASGPFLAVAAQEGPIEATELKTAAVGDELPLAPGKTEGDVEGGTEESGQLGEEFSHEPHVPAATEEAGVENGADEEVAPEAQETPEAQDVDAKLTEEPEADKAGSDTNATTQSNGHVSAQGEVRNAGTGPVTTDVADKDGTTDGSLGNDAGNDDVVTTPSTNDDAPHTSTANDAANTNMGNDAANTSTSNDSQTAGGDPAAQ